MKTFTNKTYIEQPSQGNEDLVHLVTNPKGVKEEHRGRIVKMEDYGLAVINDQLRRITGELRNKVSSAIVEFNPNNNAHGEDLFEKPDPFVEAFDGNDFFVRQCDVPSKELRVNEIMDELRKRYEELFQTLDSDSNFVLACMFTNPDFNVKEIPEHAMRKTFRKKRRDFLENEDHFNSGDVLTVRVRPYSSAKERFRGFPAILMTGMRNLVNPYVTVSRYGDILYP